MSRYIGKNSEEAVKYAIRQIVHAAQEGIKTRGKFTLALSGGSTPRAIYKRLTKSSLDWKKAFIFFSDERCVPPTSDESNYKMALDSGIGSLGIPESQIFRIKGEIDPTLAATEYQSLIETHVPNATFDLIMLGMGDDGHTASLFPETTALTETSRLVVANFVPKLNTDRITFTYPLINKAHHINAYILGASKAPMVKEIFSNKECYPIQKIDFKKTIFILDEDSASMLK